MKWLRNHRFFNDELCRLSQVKQMEFLLNLSGKSGFITDHENIQKPSSANGTDNSLCNAGPLSEVYSMSLATGHVIMFKFLYGSYMSFQTFICFTYCVLNKKQADAFSHLLSSLIRATITL